ncbi:MAG TPA: CopD family protein [Methylomirabilota bacterium]|nr:CopD family protein [Methylomirabilota bacterium]
MSRIVVVWFHVVAASVWVGGLLYSSHLMVPALARGEASVLPLLRRGRRVAWGALALLVVTGLDNLRSLGLGSRWLALKLVMVLVLLMAAAHRDFALLPRAARVIDAGRDPGSALGVLRWFDRILVVLALAVLLLAVGVARGR